MADPAIIELAVEPRKRNDHVRLVAALAGLAADDPSFGVEYDAGSGQTIIRGVSESQLDEKIRLLRASFDLNVGAPQVSYRETLARPMTLDYRDASTRVKLSVTPVGHGPNQFMADAALPRHFTAAVERGCGSALEFGPFAGFPVIGLAVSLVDGAHDGSSEEALVTAARSALREVLVAAGPMLLEPIMRIRVAASEDCRDTVMRDLIARRGTIRPPHGADAAIEAEAPCATLLGYAESLKTMSGGRASFTSRFSRYAPAPASPDDAPFRPAMALRA